MDKAELRLLTKSLKRFREINDSDIDSYTDALLKILESPETEVHQLKNEVQGLKLKTHLLEAKLSRVKTQLKLVCKTLEEEEG